METKMPCPEQRQLVCRWRREECDGVIDVLVIIVRDKCLVYYLSYHLFGLLLKTVTDTSIVSLIRNCY